MDSTLQPEIIDWLHSLIQTVTDVSKPIFSDRSEVYVLKTKNSEYYLKVGHNLNNEHDSLIKLSDFLPVPKVLGYKQFQNKDYLLMSALPGKNLAEYSGNWSNEEIVQKFAESVRNFHDTDLSFLFTDSIGKDAVLLHGDMSMPNIIFNGKTLSGFIDIESIVVGEAENDVADAIWSVQRNLGAGYGGLFLKHYGHITITERIQKALDFRFKG